MINTPYVKKDSVSKYFPVPNALFDLELHHIEIDIYAYLMRIENRRTFQCLASYPTIARKLGLSVNTVAKYVSALEEHGLIRTERTEIVTRDGLKRNAVSGTPSCRSKTPSISTTNGRCWRSSVLLTFKKLRHWQRRKV